jgi:hypothetical protein
LNTKQIKDRKERKKLKREARSKQPPKKKGAFPRGSRKKKLQKKR